MFFVYTSQKPILLRTENGFRTGSPIRTLTNLLSRLEAIGRGRAPDLNTSFLDRLEATATRYRYYCDHFWRIAAERNALNRLWEHLSFFCSRPTTAPPAPHRGGGAFSLGRGAAFTPARWGCGLCKDCRIWDEPLISNGSHLNYFNFNNHHYCKTANVITLTTFSGFHRLSPDHALSALLNRYIQH